LTQAQQSTIAFEHLWYWADELAKAPAINPSLVDISHINIALLNITREGKLQRETKDIIEELGIMLYISKKQKEVLKSFKKHGAAMLDKDGEFKARLSTEPSAMSSNPVTQHDSNKTADGRRTEEGKWMWFRANTDEVLQEHDDHLEELDGLQKSAEHVNKNVRTKSSAIRHTMLTVKQLEHLLELKQQQASVLQAWQAIRHGEEAVKQGRAIMIFTVITIIFVCLPSHRDMLIQALN
jgi:hypothetical protein